MMSVCVVIQSSGIAAGGGDVTPTAINWANIVGYDGNATTSAETLAGIDSPITLRASWTGDALGEWVVNGAPVVANQSPIDVTVTVGQTLAFTASCDPDIVEALPAKIDTYATGGTVTVINRSDGDAAIDTFTYYVETATGL